MRGRYSGRARTRSGRRGSSEVVERLREHFSAEPQETDLATAFFGEAASKGLSLVDLLSRRYDVVAANPPYMGSKNMGPSLKNYVERHFAAGKRDLYAAFILRCLELAADGGRVAMVTQQSWMFLRSFADLRALDDEKRKKAPKAFGGVLRETSIEELAHLGEHAFHEFGCGWCVCRAVCSLQGRTSARPQAHCVSARRAQEPRGEVHAPPDATAVSHDARQRAVICRPLQARFLGSRTHRSVTGFRKAFWTASCCRGRLREVADIRQGMARQTSRFLRYVWEVPGLHAGGCQYAKGGGYLKWTGLDHLAVDWHPTGVA